MNSPMSQKSKTDLLTTLLCKLDQSNTPIKSPILPQKRRLITNNVSTRKSKRLSSKNTNGTIKSKKPDDTDNTFLWSKSLLAKVCKDAISPKVKDPVSPLKTTKNLAEKEATITFDTKLPELKDFNDQSSTRLRKRTQKYDDSDFKPYSVNNIKEKKTRKPKPVSPVELKPAPKSSGLMVRPNIHHTQENNSKLKHCGECNKKFVTFINLAHHLIIDHRSTDRGLLDLYNKLNLNQDYQSKLSTKILYPPKYKYQKYSGPVPKSILANSMQVPAKSTNLIKSQIKETIQIG